MWPFNSKGHRYQAVPADEADQKEARQLHELAQAAPKQRRWRMVFLVVLVPLILAGAGFLAIFLLQPSSPALSKVAEPGSESTDSITEASPACPSRHEWRTLSEVEQQEYIAAVLCLRTQPSALAPDSNKTAYEDFPWIHSHVGYSTHGSAPFLPWHRYFLHIYETTLREKCGYGGSLVYWDWTLDSAALEHSPVFDAETGFGGDGEVGGAITVSRTGRCVVDGPFAGIEIDYYDVKYQPHCLSRGFRDLEGDLGHIDGHDITSESIEEVLSLPDYERFVTLMESRVHDAIPYGISGDFETFTAPYGQSMAQRRNEETNASTRSAVLSTPHPA